jgi:hypothetical protein
MLTIVDVDSIFMDGVAQVDEWERDFQLAFNRPLVEAAMVQNMLGLDPMLVETMRGSEMGDRLMTRVGKMKGEMGNG